MFSPQEVYQGQKNLILGKDSLKLVS